MKSKKEPDLFEQEHVQEAVSRTREMILANLSMISQVPAQTFNEKDRAEFILERFTESGLDAPTSDGMHNAIAFYPGTAGKKTILLVAHMDNQFDNQTDQNVSITEEKVYGAGIADDNLALALLMTLPDIFRRVKLELSSNLVLLACTRHHGRGDFGGMRQFIKDFPQPIHAAIRLSGVSLGTINYFTLSRVRCDIRCEIEPDLDRGWNSFGAGNAIMVMNEIIDSLSAIPLPRKPRTVLNFGMISGGERYSRPGRKAMINLEVLSEDDNAMSALIDEIKSCCTDIAARNAADVSVEFFGRHRAASLTSKHPFIRKAISVIKDLGCQPKMEYSNSEICVSLAAGIPSFGLALTTGKGGSHVQSYIDLPPLQLGILQLLTILKGIDAESNL